MKFYNHLEKANVLKAKSFQNILTVFLLLVGLSSYSQDNKIEADMMQESLQINSPKIPQNYTATKISLGKNASSEQKKEFVSKHGQDFYYTYTDPQGKVVTKEEVDYILKSEKETNTNLLPNIKK